ncbi:bifunctional DNA primase/polymerase [Streptomyces xanthochromogenes]|uniref:bifunctional DNA primase/polymerase n=1 Tax=Streptomyces xanthochromogenes TaxID=67384 RepID=UPI002F4244B6
MTNWQNALDSALYAIERGHAVFPLSINKTPAIRSPHTKGHHCKAQCGKPGHGVHDATTNPAYARQLFDLAPRATGYGIACQGRFVGLDIDRKNGVDGCAALNQLATQHSFSIPQTTTICTPSGGFHLWLSIPAGYVVPNSAGRLGPGIDVRGTGGYLVGPGSTGQAGEYALHPKLGEVAVQPVPEQLLKLMLPPPVVRPQRQFEHTAQTASKALDGLVRVVLNAPEGTRNDRLYWAATKAWAHVDDGHIAAATAEAALISAATSVGLSAAEAYRTIVSAQRGVAA